MTSRSSMSSQGPSPVVALLSTSFPLSGIARAFAEHFPQASVRIHDPEHDLSQLGNLADIDVAVCWEPPPGLLARMPKLRLIQALSAGVDHITTDPELPNVPICRIIDPHMASGMAAYVTWAVTHRHRLMDAYLASAARGQWQEQAIVAASQYRVGIAGLGVLGSHCASVLSAIGYQVRGWSRSPKPDLPEGVQGFAGDAALPTFLDGLDALICLLPLTNATKGFLNANVFAALARGAHVINVGRGEHLVEADLLAALQSGQLGYATLDAFAVEPLPGNSPLWHHPAILVTPHIATRTAPAVIAQQTRANDLALLRGEIPAAMIDRHRGY